MLARRTNMPERAVPRDKRRAALLGLLAARATYFSKICHLCACLRWCAKLGEARLLPAHLPFLFVVLLVFVVLLFLAPAIVIFVVLVVAVGASARHGEP